MAKKEKKLKLGTKHKENGQLEFIQLIDSPIHGKGVRAIRKIKEGKDVVEYTGKICKWRDYEEPDDAHTFLMSLDEKWVIDAGKNGGIARYVNHCCDPNSYYEQRGRRVFIVALRDIKPGEEVTVRYDLEVDDIEADAQKYVCKCGSEKCTGSMIDPNLLKNGH